MYFPYFFIIHFLIVGTTLDEICINLHITPADGINDIDEDLLDL